MELRPFTKLGSVVFMAVIFSAIFLAPNIATPQDLGSSEYVTADNPHPVSEKRPMLDFRVESVPVKGGAEIITIFGKTEFLGGSIGGDERNEEIPLLSVLRDTLGDDIPENDQLRYIWVMTHTKPGFWQRAASFVPFLYFRTNNRTEVGSSPPPVVADVRRSNKKLWNQIFWTVFRRVMLNDMRVGYRLSGIQARQNRQDLNRSAVATALAVMALFEKIEGQNILSASELQDIQARLWLKNKPLGWHMRDENLERVYEKEVHNKLNSRLHNWEILRQGAEDSGLYFEPLEMPDGSSTHALLWIDADEALQGKERNFSSRFLSIKDPWRDKKIRNWTGYIEERWYDKDSREVDPDTVGANRKRLIPLALYGLDSPKIPMILVDFRDNSNPKRREMSKRILADLTDNVLTVTGNASIPYFVGRFLYDFVTIRRGMDVNQASRLRIYAQLKTLLALDHSLDPELRKQISGRLERVSMNPLENDLAAQVKIAKANYANLMAYADRAIGLPAKLDRSRREAMVKHTHGKSKQYWYKAGRVLSFGLYQHREKATPELTARMSIVRQLEFHERSLRETSARSIDPTIDSDIGSLKRSLAFISEHGKTLGETTSHVIAKIFWSTSDEDLRRLCLSALYKIENTASKKEMLKIYNDENLPSGLRIITATYLRKARDEGQRLTKRNAMAINELLGN